MNLSEKFLFNKILNYNVDNKYLLHTFYFSYLFVLCLHVFSHGHLLLLLPKITNSEVNVMNLLLIEDMQKIINEWGYFDNKVYLLIIPFCILFFYNCLKEAILNKRYEELFVFFQENQYFFIIKNLLSINNENNETEIDNYKMNILIGILKNENIDLKAFPFFNSLINNIKNEQFKSTQLKEMQIEQWKTLIDLYLNEFIKTNDKKDFLFNTNIQDIQNMTETKIKETDYCYS